MSGALNGSILGFAGTENMLVGAMSGVSEDGLNQVLGKATGQRQEINSALIVEGGWIEAIGNARTQIFKVLGLGNPNTTFRVIQLF